MKKIHPLLDKKRQKEAKKYEKEKRLLGLIGSVVSLMVLIVFYFAGFSEKVAFLNPGDSVVLAFLIYIIVFQLIIFIMGLPISFYSGYIHEHKWNFSNQTVKTWLWEQIKSFLVGFILMALVLALLFWVMDLFSELWWLISGLAFSVVSVILATLFPVVILPIFNKYTPIKDKELTESLEKILSREGLKSGGFFKEDMSRQTKKENAFLAGLGKTRRVVLGDNLMNEMDIHQIESIIAHEVGHYKHKHIWKNIAIGVFQGLIVFFLLDKIMNLLFPEFLSSFKNNLTLFPMFVLWMVGISSFLFAPLSNAVSRCFEKQADLYSLGIIRDKNAFMKAIAGLANRNLSNAYPPWWVKMLYYSHPPIGERLELAEQYRN